MDRTANGGRIRVSSSRAGSSSAPISAQSSNQPGGGNYSNAPYLYDQIPNSINLHQADIHVSRQPDTYQTDHIDWGFRVDALYGQDYRYTTMKGLFSNQLLTNNQQYGYDMP